MNIASIPVALFVHWAVPRLLDRLYDRVERRADRKLARHEAGGLEAMVSRGRRRLLIPDAAGRLELARGIVAFRRHDDGFPLWWVHARDVTVRLPDLDVFSHVFYMPFHSHVTGHLQVSPARHPLSRAYGSVRGGLWITPLTYDGCMELAHYVVAHGGTVLDVTGMPLTDRDPFAGYSFEFDPSDDDEFFEDDDFDEDDLYEDDPSDVR